MFSLPADKAANCEKQLIALATAPTQITNNRTKNYITLPETCCTEFSAIHMDLEGFHVAI
jgi:hypothetical protein